MSTLFPLATLIAAIGSGLMAGLFFAFSVSIMRALGRLKPPEGIAAMQAINVAIVNPIFAVVFFGTAVACGVVLVMSLFRTDDPSAAFLIAGSALYLIGGMLVTFVCNIPRNNALAAVSSHDPDSAALWTRYLREWTRWNHVRTITCLLAALLLTIAMCP